MDVAVLADDGAFDVANVKLVTLVPLLLYAVIIYSVSSVAISGVPVIMPVELLKTKPDGNEGLMVYPVKVTFRILLLFWSVMKMNPLLSATTPDGL